MRSLVSSPPALLALYMSAFLMAFNGLFSKIIPADAVTITGARSFLALPVFAIFFFLKKRSLSLHGVKQIVAVYALGAIFALHWVSFFHAMQISSVAIGILSLFSFPVMTVFLEPLFAKSKLKLSDVLASFCVLLGIALLVLKPSENGLFDVEHGALYGVLWGVFSALCMTLRNLVQKYHFSDVGSGKLMFHQLVSVGFVTLFFWDMPALSKFNSIDWLFLLLLAVFCTAIAHTLFVSSLLRLPAKTAAMVGCIQPVLAVFFAWLVLSEKPSVYVFLGGALILCVAVYESLNHHKSI